LNRLVFPAILAIAISASAAPAELGQLDASPTMFTVMAALSVAGYSADLGSPNNHPLRDQVRSELLRRNLPCQQALKDFYEAHRKRGGGADTAELAQYISFALSVQGPPDFGFVGRDVEVPPDAVSLRGFSSLLARFYKEADIPELWKRSQPAIDQYIARYHEPVAGAVVQVNAYLRQLTNGFRASRFQVFIELLAAPNQIQTRSYGTNYYIVVTPSPEPRTFDIRHAYLHYLLDPLSTRERDVLERKKPIADHALRAQALDQAFKDDFLLLTTESLIKAVEARLDHKPEGVQQAFHQGYILTPYFAEQLPAFEKDGQGMNLYYPDMVKAIDLFKEDKRLTDLEFDREPPKPALVPVPAPAAPPPLGGAAKTLDDAEQLYLARDKDKENLAKARKLYLDALLQTGDPPMQAAAYYGLARIALLQNDPDAAEQLFHKALDSQPEPQVKAWVLVYLGRLSLAAADGGQAAVYFQQSLKVDGASDMARKAAADGLQNSSKK
jgi:tetratricopeptide (TPR) repeat protein